MNKNSLKKCWRQIDEAMEALERLMDNDLVHADQYEYLFDSLSSVKQDIEKQFDPPERKSAGEAIVRCIKCDDILTTENITDQSAEQYTCKECYEEA